MHNKTSWEKVSGWYDKKIGDKGDYFHEHLVIPNSLKLLNLKEKDNLLDLACGQGVLARHLPKTVEYTGIDISSFLIKEAKSRDKSVNHNFLTADITKSLDLKFNSFSSATIILALQNLENPGKAILNVSRVLKPGGKLLIVINHPCFRIPRQSGWGINEKSKQQYRFVNRYLSFLKIPINMEPGRRSGGQITWSYHYSISQISFWLRENHLLIERIDEWSSQKKSEGRVAKMENLARAEIPLFMAILAQKK